MQRIAVAPRHDWKNSLKDAGFHHFENEDGTAYWDETSAYRFTAEETQLRFKTPAEDLHEMMRKVVARVVSSPKLMDKLNIPAFYQDLVKASWDEDQSEFCGRMDFIYDGKSPAKLLEYNAEAAGTLLESTLVQSRWLNDVKATGELPAAASEFNATFSAISRRLNALLKEGQDVHFASAGGPDMVEDYVNVTMMMLAASDAGLVPHYVSLDDIAVSTEDQLIDDQSRVIGDIYMFYAWEDMLRDDFMSYVPNSGARFIEPAWRTIMSNKGILPLLWEMFEGHENLLPAYFADDIDADRKLAIKVEREMQNGQVRKPIFSCAGSSITITKNGIPLAKSEDMTFDDHKSIIQAYEPALNMGGSHPVIGAWLVGRSCTGIGVLEDATLITQDRCLFKPHFILG